MQDGARDHGGDLDRAIHTYGAGHWLDLSTGINPCPYPVPPLDPSAWSNLPTRTEISALEAVAARAYAAHASVVAVAGAQAAIQLIPRLKPQGRACVVGPTYNEHAGALVAQGWRVETVVEPRDANGADLLIVVNPNNPDGRAWSPDTLLGVKDTVGLLVVDESFADFAPEASLAPHITQTDANVVVLRSFGKFYGLAGVRLGFAIASSENAERLRALAGPWAVSGPAIATGVAALSDIQWQEQTRVRLSRDAIRLDALASEQGWTVLGGTPLFRTYETENAEAAQQGLAQNHIWSRIFPYSKTWLRLGLPGSEDDWGQLENAFANF